MLVTLKEVLEYASFQNKAVGSFNTPNLESILAVIAAAEELKEPVILMHAQVHEEIMPLSVIGPVMIEHAKAAKVPVCVHLDHGETLDYIRKALELGFTSVMYDGSVLAYGENVKNTKAAVAMAQFYGASVEAEIGTLGKRESGHKEEDGIVDTASAVYTNSEDARNFVEATAIDALACSFGTAHGLYLKKPCLDMTVLDNIKAILDIPLVMHGGSGVSEEDYKRVIQKGVRKINYYTYMAKAGADEIRSRLGQQRTPVYFHEIAGWGAAAMKDNVKQAITVFSGK